MHDVRVCLALRSGNSSRSPIVIIFEICARWAVTLLEIGVYMRGIIFEFFNYGRVHTTSKTLQKYATKLCVDPRYNCGRHLPSY